jgi:hypothetical protein
LTTEIDYLVSENSILKLSLEDGKRIDWLSDKGQSIGNVMLPTGCIERNISSLRDAIDDAMEM